MKYVYCINCIQPLSGKYRYYCLCHNSTVYGFWWWFVYFFDYL